MKVLLALLSVVLLACTAPVAVTRPAVGAASALVNPQATEAAPRQTSIPTPVPTPGATAAATPTPVATSTPSPSPTATASPTPPLPTRSPTKASGALTVLPGGEIVRGPSHRARIALTFDAGGRASHTPTILSTLRRYGVKGTFFLTGTWVEKYLDLVKEIAADGHEFGNHSYSHPDFTKLSEDEMAEELERTEMLVRQTTGSTTKPWFRPPFGSRDPRVLGVLAKHGYRSVYWTLDSGDWRSDVTAAGEFKRVIENAANGAIIVFHADAASTAEVLPQIIERLREMGFEMVELSKLLED